MSRTFFVYRHAESESPLVVQKIFILVSEQKTFGVVAISFVSCIRGYFGLRLSITVD
jgi:hypothetical protein